MSTLSREQVEQFLPLATLDRTIVNVADGWVGVNSALRMMIDHDAAQRDLLRQREEDTALAIEQARSQERGYWKQQLAARTQERDRKSGLIKDLTQTLKNRNEQLAASQARCAQLEEALSMWTQHYAGRLYSDADLPEIFARSIRALTSTERTPV